ncbi:hypothetical protein GLAREA_03645 [Glarea lozoyensis ATCC 20868]|uniref:Uncharacterized protein n=1 Tax=Glarea lozoyensis (strain ATCC 20868 / MF5171) TaxID=1116229 RepID=S3DWB7_GLAL2|nr:uncharacterized protein GLAREA_03645 [Glarea lozoyensis ATCC 20868]EPE30678.1 hypothetical protein GLAREA_03645 [Glarea lozoyensis ATCC 20868]
MAMQKGFSKHMCPCRHSALSYSSPLLFLSIILPRSSYAQFTSQSTSVTPTTLFTSASSSSPSTSLGTPTDNSSSGWSNSSTGTHAFNYYFVIVAVAAVFFCLALLYFGKRKKQKAALMRRNSQRALAQDVAGFNLRSRGGRARNNGRGFWNGTRREEDRVEGLDERGEAPPPYVPGGKPPSIRAVSESVDLADARDPHGAFGGSVELSTLPSGLRSNADPPPPDYHEHGSGGSEDIGDITRPAPAFTNDRHESSRRLLGNSNGSTV